MISDRNSKSWRGLGLAVLMAVIFTDGCTAPVPPPAPALTPPGVAVEERHFAGTPLSGPLATEKGGPSVQDVLDARVTFYALARMAPEAFEPLLPRARLIVATREDSPVVPSPRLMATVRIAGPDGADGGAGIEADLRGGKLGKFALVATQESALITGATAAFALSQAKGESDQFPGQLKSQRLELQLYRPGAGEPMQAALQLNDFVAGAAPPESEEAFAAPEARTAYAHGAYLPSKTPARPVRPPVFQSELALFNPAGASGGDLSNGPETFALIAPMHFGDSESQAILVIVQISAPPAGQLDAQMVTHAVDDIGQSSAAAARVADLIHTDPADWPGLSGAVESLAYAGRQRAGLLFMADQTGAQTTEDVVLSADEAVVSRLAHAAGKTIAAAPGERTHKSIGWILERTTYQMLIEIQSGGKLPAELESILAIRTGQAGRSSGTLQEVLANATGQQDMLNRLAAENYIFLEDSSPAARVRAYDWLTTLKLAPPGFDPLATPRQRRAALEQAEQTPRTASGAGGQSAAN